MSDETHNGIDYTKALTGSDVSKAQPPSELVAPAGSVFEVVDVTSEESYYTMGVWPSLEAAVNALRAHGTDAPGEHDDDCCVVEVRERKIGVLDWSETGRLRWKFVWEKKYDASDDGYEWRVNETQNAPGSLE